MPKAPNVVVIKVSREVAGITIPFDKLYFFRREDRELIPKIFGYALVLPVSEELVTKIKRLRPKSLSHYKHQRDDEALHQPPTIGGTLLDGRTHSQNQIKEWWDTTLFVPEDLTERVVVIPILTKKVRKKIQARYLSSKKWYDRQKSQISARNRYARKAAPQAIISALPEVAYLATPEAAPDDKINPICTICPRNLLQLQGKCTPGELVCYKSLDFNSITTTAELPVATEEELAE